MAAPAARAPVRRAANPAPAAGQNPRNQAVVRKAVAARQAVNRALPGEPKPLQWNLSDTQGVWYIYAPHWEARTDGVIACIEQTWVKRTTAYSWELPEWEKREIMVGQELRIKDAPALVDNPYEQKRHKWTHLHRKVQLGEMERAKAELVEAHKALANARVKMVKEKERELQLAEARKMLGAAKGKLDKEMQERQRLGLSMDIDPFDENFEVGPAIADSGALLAGSLGAPVPPAGGFLGAQEGAKTMPPTPPAAAAGAAPVMPADAVTKYFEARGKVQGVMFRQTLINGSKRRNLLAGATNEEAGHVTITLTGSVAQIQQLVEVLVSGKHLNDWGAMVESINEVAAGKAMADHQVSTGNVDSIQWNPNVKMYL